MKVRIIKTEKCSDCRAYIKRLDKVGFVYESMDGNDQRFSKELDEWKIDKMPVVQILSDSGELLFQFPPGSFSPLFINNKIKELEKKHDSQSRQKEGPKQAN